MHMITSLPSRIVCLTEETTEWLYMLQQEHRIVGISGYTVRPRRAREEKPKVSAFLSAKVDKILELKPDCVFGFSDLQADIAAQLIRAGVQVTVFNQRSVEEIYSMLYQVAAMVGQADRGLQLIEQMRQRIEQVRATTAGWPVRPKVYFEEWDEPRISAIQWVSQLISYAGGADIFPDLAAEPMGKNRILADDSRIIAQQPDLIIGSWCGKKFRPEKVAARAGWAGLPAVVSRQIHEIKSADILQPGPAALTDGFEQLHQIFANWVRQANDSH
jgi:iron complex transport system substrate-binding protein